MSKISWTELGEPTTPGEVRIRGLGKVQVTAENIAGAKAEGGEVDFDLIDVTSLGDNMKKYLLGMMS